MYGPFSLTWRSIEADGFRRFLAGLLLLFLAVIGVGGYWFFTSPIALYVVTDQSRLEVQSSAHRVEAPEFGGEIVALPMEPGQRVAPGDLLAELDTDQLQKQLESEQARRGALTREIASVEAQIGSLERAVGEGKGAAGAELREARAFHREAEAEAANAEEEAARAEKLQADGHVSVKDLEKARSEAAARRSAAQALKERLDRLEGEHRETDSLRQAELDDLRGRLARLQGSAGVAAATAAGLEHAIGRRQIRSPIAGRIAEVSGVEEGSYLDAGQWIGTIVPDGEFKVVAWFPPQQALGRVLPGQPARLKLDAYPWTLHGGVDAVVSQVASEARDGRIRVELEIGEVPDQMTLQHGLPGQLEVRVETLTPSSLVLRSLGRRTSSVPAVTQSETGRK